MDVLELDSTHLDMLPILLCLMELRLDHTSSSHSLGRYVVTVALYPAYPLSDWNMIDGIFEPYSTFDIYVSQLPEDEQVAIRRFIAGPGSTGYDIR